jgi:hypothetical protein
MILDHQSENFNNKCQLSIPIILGTLISFAILIYIAQDKKTNYQEYALKNRTVSLFSKINGFQIHCRIIEDNQPCINNYYKNSKNNDLILYLGNSQLHAINQYKNGDENTPLILHKKLNETDLGYLVTYSQPNANLQEHYLLFEYLRIKMPIKALILPLVFDDMRETGIRHDFAVIMKDKSTQARLKQTDIGKKLFVYNELLSVDAEDMAALKDTTQDRTEKYFNSWLDENLTVWAARPDFRGKLLTTLYRIRNSVFNIKATTKRKVIKDRYINNFFALKAILESANLKKTSVLLYIVPLRNDVEMPYITEEYEAFKEDLVTIASKYDVKLLNLENLISAEHWGAKASTSLVENEELDFMHFQSSGHMILGKTLYEVLKNELKTVSTELNDI